MKGTKLVMTMYIPGLLALLREKNEPPAFQTTVKLGSLLTQLCLI